MKIIKVEDNKDPLKQGRIFAENQWYYPICGGENLDYGHFTIPQIGEYVTIEKQYYFAREACTI